VGYCERRLEDTSQRIPRRIFGLLRPRPGVGRAQHPPGPQYDRVVGKDGDRIRNDGDTAQGRHTP
jgi:hypothetical protein